MNSSKLDEARTFWLKEKEIFLKYGVALKSEIKEVLKTANIPVTLSHRIKGDDSLLKKMLMKDKTYDDVNDKVGVRAVVHFLSDLRSSDVLICEAFEERIKKRESKLEVSDDSTFGYLSIHYDIANCALSENPLICELQLRTVCQNAWSELAHILSYKPGIDIPSDIKREINALSALMEIADNQFQMILDMINELPVSNPVRILSALDGFFHSSIAAWYDSEMSHYFLDDVASLYDSDEDIINMLNIFIEKNGSDISSIASKRPDVLFFSQPEIVVILERLESKQLMLEKYWESKYPMEQLEAIANAWGKSLV